ncbi:Esterase PHB depolymerase [Pseudobythopirellula maris]|uniref:Esterase PHB depolymerase n=1 Tax=Pseudobythopirellula maris TaxID=2527991 RepID=A0A5C5ZI99_9BACT|nr:alpha/beta hydrolase-fold protein [Pseudobythopirellula maris]TWT86531.1 Esterase PHB depolymerase [Pseudobythopirellula maris]
MIRQESLAVLSTMDDETLLRPTAHPEQWRSAFDACDEPRAPVAAFSPTGYEAGYAYPLVVWLHSSGASEEELATVLPHVSCRNHVGVAPRGVAPSSLGRGYAWRGDRDGYAAAEESVFTAIDSVKNRFHIHNNRVFVAGVGVGGTTAVRLALAHPDRFAGAATFGGPLPTGDRLLRRVNEARELPLLIAASRKSDAYPEGRVCEDLRLLHSAGCRVAVRQYPGDDDLTTAMLSDLDRWIMDHVCGVNATSANRTDA